MNAWVVNQFKMPTTRLRSAVIGGLPEAPTGWPPSGRPGGSREARNLGNAARTARNRDAANAEGTIDANKEVGANKDVVVEDCDGADPCSNDPPNTVLMGMLACGLGDTATAQSLARNLFLNSFSRCPKVTRKDMKDTFETLERT